MIRTAVNVTGDAVVSVVVAKSENKLDENIYNDSKSGIVLEENITIDKESEVAMANAVHKMHDKV